MKGIYTVAITDSNHINMLKSVLETIKPALTGKIYVERYHDNGEGFNRTYNVYKITADNQAYI